MTEYTGCVFLWLLLPSFSDGVSSWRSYLWLQCYLLPGQWLSVQVDVSAVGHGRSHFIIWGIFFSCPQDAAQDDTGFSELRRFSSKYTDRMQGGRKLMDSCSRCTSRQICIYTLQTRMLWQIQTKACGFFSAMQGNNVSFAIIYTTWGGRA